MTVGEVISLICAYCAKWDNLCSFDSTVYDIEVCDGLINLHFANGDDVEIIKSDYFKD